MHVGLRSIRTIPPCLAVIALAASACAPPPRGPAPPGGTVRACAPLEGIEVAQERGDAPDGGGAEVILAGPVDPAHAPAAANAAERLVFRQLYETLVEIDCEGRARPGLAVSWSHEEGRRWRFTLDEGARFWDGTPVSAEAVARGWAARGMHAPSAGPRIVSAAVAGERELTVELSEPSFAPEVFARPALAVVSGASGPWPRGTGPWRPSGDPVAEAAGPIRIVSRDPGPEESLLFRVAERGDARAALDAGADVLVSAEPDAIAYARALPGFGVAPLPWSRTYVLAAPWDEEPAEPPEPVPPGELEGLARGAVRAEARAAEPPFWWMGADPCGPRAEPPGPPTPGEHRTSGRGTGSRIVYPLGDEVARGLAERLVALAGRGAAPPPWLRAAVPGLAVARRSVVAAGLGPADLERAVRDASRVGALAFVAAVPRAPGGVCLSALLASEGAPGRALLDPASGLRVTPLVDVRSSLLVRAGVPDITVDGFGTLLFRPRGALPGEGGR